jgi:hypothetical protein
MLEHDNAGRSGAAADAPSTARDLSLTRPYRRPRCDCCLALIPYVNTTSSPESHPACIVCGHLNSDTPTEPSIYNG